MRFSIGDSVYNYTSIIVACGKKSNRCVKKDSMIKQINEYSKEANKDMPGCFGGYFFEIYPIGTDEVSTAVWV